MFSIQKTLYIMMSVCSLGYACNAAAEPSVYPTGVTIDQPYRTFDTFVMFSGADGITHLIDMGGGGTYTNGAIAAFLVP